AICRSAAPNALAASATPLIWSGISPQGLLLAVGDSAAAGDVEGLTVALRSGMAGRPLVVETCWPLPAESLVAATFSFAPFCTYHQSPAALPASKSNTPKIDNTSLPLDPVFAEASPNTGASSSNVAALLFNSGATTSLNIGVDSGADITTSGAATIAG